MTEMLCQIVCVMISTIVYMFYLNFTHWHVYESIKWLDIDNNDQVTYK